MQGASVASIRQTTSGGPRGLQSRQGSQKFHIFLQSKGASCNACFTWCQGSLLLLLFLGHAEQGTPQGCKLRTRGRGLQKPDLSPADGGSPPSWVTHAVLSAARREMCLCRDTLQKKRAEKDRRSPASLSFLHLLTSESTSNYYGLVHVTKKEGGRFPVLNAGGESTIFHLHSQLSAIGLGQ